MLPKNRLKWEPPVQGSCSPYKVWGTKRVIDSYKVPAVDSNYEDTSHWQSQGSRSGVSLPPRTGGFNFNIDGKNCGFSNVI